MALRVNGSASRGSGPNQPPQHMPYSERRTYRAPGWISIACARVGPGGRLGYDHNPSDGALGMTTGRTPINNRMNAMKMMICIGIFVIALAPWLAQAQEANALQPALPIGMTGDYETVQSKITKVYSAEEEGARFRAYVVNWKGNEVIISDPLGETDKKVGDDVTFLAQRIEIPQDNEIIRLLQFMILELPEFTMPPATSEALGSGKK